MIYGDKDIPEVLRLIADQWRSTLEQSKRHKEEVYGQKARECYQHYAGPRDWDELMGKDMGTYDPGDMHFKMHVNKAFEYVSLFGPYLYYDNPVRTVKPRATFEVPPAFYADALEWQTYIDQEQVRTMIDGVRAAILEKYVNWTPGEFHLDVESRLAIAEALIKGRGCLWSEINYLPNGTKAVSSKWHSVNWLFCDPDASSFKEAKWIARRHCKPTWEVEQFYGLRKGSLKGNLESQAVQGEILFDDDAQYDRKRGLTNDLIVYYEIWSKMGIGGRLHGMKESWRGPLDKEFGDYAYIVISPNVHFPLNMNPDLFNAKSEEAAEQVKEMVQWPIPFHENDEWPVTVLDFAPVFNSPWPLPPLMAARGEMRFLSWIMSFLAGHIRNACRTFVGMKKSLGEEIKTAIISGSDLTLLEIEHDHGAVSDCITFLEHPEVNGDIWTYMEAVNKAFEQRTGLTEVMSGGQRETQPRSAAESNMQQESAGVRPDDMARQVAAWQAAVAAKEAGTARYFITSKDVLLPLGPMAASIWDTYILTTDPTDAFKQLEYRIEAGSTRKPNKEFQVRQMTEAMQTMAPIFLQYAQMTTDLGPINALVQDWAKSRDLDPQRYMLTMAPQPSPMPVASGGNPTPEGEMHSPPPSPMESSDQQTQPAM